MRTRVLTIDPSQPDEDVLAEAAGVIVRSGLVAFPTETVYGLGANALSAPAVEAIFAAKGRPAANPVIVHVADAAAARTLVTSWPDIADTLARRFWPGPLTLVLPRSANVPDVVTAGGATVAVRVPSHPVALGLLRLAGVPVAAPSANRSSQISPTEAAHVLRGLDGRIDLVLDGGRCPGGIESTVLDLTTDPPRLLRPGLVTARAIESIAGPLDLAAPTSVGPLRSPGMLARHYAPDASMEILTQNGEYRVEELAKAGLRIGWLKLGLAGNGGRPRKGWFVIELPDEPEGYAAGLYAALHSMDQSGVDRIIVDAPPESPDWLAVNDRLRRAASPP